MFGIRLKELRNQRNLTQLEVGKYIGVTRSTVAGYECKGKEPSFAILIAIADFFDVSLDYLLGSFFLLSHVIMYSYPKYFGFE